MGLIFDEKLVRRITHTSNQPNDTDRLYESRIMRSMTAIVTVGAIALAGIAVAKHNNTAEKASAEQTCYVYGEQTVQPSSGDGITALIHQIQGSGAGEGDPCWGAAQEAVEQAVGTGIPRTDRTYVIPSVVSVEKLDQNAFQPAE